MRLLFCSDKAPVSLKAPWGFCCQLAFVLLLSLPCLSRAASVDEVFKPLSAGDLPEGAVIYSNNGAVSPHPVVTYSSVNGDVYIGPFLSLKKFPA